MEVFAGFGGYPDPEIGRLIQAIEATGQLDNTLIFYIVGDNGASAEGGMSGLFNEMTYFNGVHETVQDVLKHYDELGGPMTYPHYAAGSGGAPARGHRRQGRGALPVAPRHRHPPGHPQRRCPPEAESHGRHAADPDR